ncbi:MAG: twin-arginine translocation signal domain-containing protein [Elusimicrobiota bacterium]
MKKLTRRNFIKGSAILIAGILSGGLFKNKKPDEDKKLKEADFYKKHDLSG